MRSTAIENQKWLFYAITAKNPLWHLDFHRVGLLGTKQRKEEKRVDKEGKNGTERIRPSFCSVSVQQDECVCVGMDLWGCRSRVNSKTSADTTQILQPSHPQRVDAIDRPMLCHILQQRLHNWTCFAKFIQPDLTSQHTELNSPKLDRNYLKNVLLSAILC